tara:strand:+ start:1139 stop:2848 length:1710 start_codon:yes stop_codon:yes gene_type:complete
MNDIKKLDTHLINQIAAGEVVDSPASILKELIENSIDAKSTIIKIHIYNGGKNKIIIKDNGIGIDSDNLDLAFERFATSKISTIDDLENISTLGFRGEALPSIASVSKFKISSIYKNQEGNELLIDTGKKKSVKPSNIVEGTEITVKDLFYKLPARKKFLKSDTYEYKKCLNVFKRYIISNPTINFTLSHNDKIVYNYKSTTLKSRIVQLLNLNSDKDLIKVSIEKDDVKIDGYICNLTLIKKRKDFQYTYINGRYIQNQLLSNTVYSCYRSLIERGEHPCYFLNITMNTKDFDINVHPKKLEIKFSNELKIQYILKQGVSKSLKRIDKVIPDFYQNDYSNNDLSIDLPFTNNNADDNNDINIEKKIDKIIDDNDNDNKISHDNKVWQIHNKYILTEIQSGLVIIDQHVAHERVLYEEALRALEGEGLDSQKILFPQTIKFDKEDYIYLLEILYYLKKIGFDIREFGDSSIIIEGVPMELTIGKEQEIINDILDNYIQNKKVSSSFIDYMAATYSCKAAIKAGEKLSNEECYELINQLFNTKHPYYCPHGRPIIINLSIDDLDKRFERK